MASLMLVNPRKRRTTKKRRSPAQRAATRALVARNKRRTPARRRSSYSKTVTVRRRRNPIKRRSIITRAVDTAKNGAIGSVGAIAGSIVSAYLPVPENLKAGNMGIVMQAIIGIGTGYGVAKFANRKFGEQMAQGAVTVALHGAMKNMIQSAVPSIQMSDDLLGYQQWDNGLLGSDWGDDLSAYDQSMGYSGAGYTGDSMGAYDDDTDDLNFS
jgi:hypothetical protein